MYYNEQEERMAHEENDGAQAQAEAEMQEYKRPMPVERQVSSLELSKRLKELGVTQESLFYFDDKGHIIASWNWNDVAEEYPEDWGLIKSGYTSAFTVAELGEIMKGKRMGISAFSSIQKQWWIRGGEDTNGHYEHLEMSDTEADARAKMLIYLLLSQVEAA